MLNILHERMLNPLGSAANKWLYSYVQTKPFFIYFCLNSMFTSYHVFQRRSITHLDKFVCVRGRICLLNCFPFLLNFSTIFPQYFFSPQYYTQCSHTISTYRWHTNENSAYTIMFVYNKNMTITFASAGVWPPTKLKETKG